MKKIISVLILLAFLSAAAFAEYNAGFEPDITQNLLNDDADPNANPDNRLQGIFDFLTAPRRFNVGFELDITQNLISATTPLDDDADPNNPNNRFPGSFDFFTANRNDMRQSEMFLRFNYVTENLDARLELTGHSLVNRRDRGLREGYSFLGLFDELRIGDFWVRGNMDVSNAFSLNAAYGRLHTRGVMDDFRFDDNTWWDRRYTGASADILGPFRFFGFQMPGRRYTEVNNHRAIHGGEHYMLVGANFADFGLELSGSRQVPSAGDHGSAISFGVRGSAINVADLITFEVMYGVTGRDPTRDTADGRGRWEHRFGLYGGTNLLDGNLGLSFGYSGGFLSYENWAASARPGQYIDLQRRGPLFHGIDLKAQFSGVENLTVTGAVNATFSSVRGTNIEDGTWRLGLGILPRPHTDPYLRYGQEESFFGLAVGFIAGYQFTDNLDFALQVKNSTQWESYVNADRELDRVRNLLGVALTARFAFNENISIMSGLAMQMDRTSLEIGNTRDSSGGDLYFGIPITFHVRF